LLISTPWTQETIKFKGNVHPVPRLTAWYSKIGRDYSYSGIRAKAEPYTPLLASINQKVETIANREFNSVLLNYYRNGHDCVSWHADDEKSLGPSVDIASMSLGVTRDFQLKKKDKKGKTLTVALPHGSLLIMEAPMQALWLHQIPRRKNVTEPRINLTFRFIHE